MTTEGKTQDHAGRRAPRGEKKEQVFLFWLASACCDLQSHAAERRDSTITAPAHGQPKNRNNLLFFSPPWRASSCVVSVYLPLSSAAPTSLQ